MPIYDYTALKNGKDVIKGSLEATNHKEARELIRKMGYLPTKIVETNKSGSGSTEKKVDFKKIQKMNLGERVEFTSTFQILVQSGIPVIEALTFIENDATNKKLKSVAQELRRQIMMGSTFADTVARYPEVFGQIYIGLVRAGEDAGELEKTMERLLELLKKEENIRSRVVGALMYPVFVIILAMLVTTVMLVFVFPAFAEMFETMDKELPWITKTLMDLGVWLKTYWPAIPLIFGTVIFGSMFLLRWNPSKRIIDKYVLKIPLISKLIQFANFSNFVSVMQVAYDAGIPVVDCLYLSNITLTNTTLRDKISMATADVQQGKHLSVALRATKAMPGMILFMIATGEQSGRLGDMMAQATVFIDKTLDKVIDTMTKAIEPIMLIVIGGIVLVLALALYLPLFQSYEI